MDTSRVRLLPTGAGTMPLKPPFPSLYYCSELGGPEASRGVTASMVFPAHGYRGVTLLMTCLATPYLGDALSWRRPVGAVHLLTLALTFTLTLTLVNAWGWDGTQAPQS